MDHVIDMLKVQEKGFTESQLVLENNVILKRREREMYYYSSSFRLGYWGDKLGASHKSPLQGRSCSFLSELFHQYYALILN